MERNIEVYVKNVGKLDLDSKLIEEFGLEIEFSNTEIGDVGSRKSNFSKTFKVIGTPNNNKIFQHVYDIAFDSDTYDMNKRIPSYITLNKHIIIDGYLKLRNIEKQYINDGKYQIIYEINIYDSIASIFSTLGEKKLSELDFALPFYLKSANYDKGNHIYSIDTIINCQSRNKNYGNIYEYPLFNYNYAAEGVKDVFNSKTFSQSMFYPSVYVKAIIDKIFSENKFTYTSDFFDGNTFDGIYLQLATIYNRATMLTNSDYIKFEVANDMHSNTYNSPDAPEIDDTDFGYILTPILEHQVDTILSGNNINIKGDGKYHCYLTYIAYDNSIEDYETKLFFVVNNEEIEYEHFVVSGDTQLFEFDLDLKQNDILNLYLKVGYYIDGNYLGSSTSLINFNLNMVYNYPNLIEKKDTELIIADYLPDVTQAEFFKSIIKMFNLYIDLDKDDEFNLIIEPRNVYFGKGKVVDWTNKLDNSIINIKPMADKINKVYSFNMPKNDIYTNRLYYDKWSTEYGTKYIDTQNADLVGTNNIDTIFGGYDFTYIKTSGDYILIPKLFKTELDSITTAKIELPPMIGFISEHTTSPVVYNIIGNVNPVPKWTTICHVEQFGENLIKHDLNFTTLQGVDGYVNSYDTFWKNQIENLLNINNRIIEYYVKLDFNDIINLDLKNVISIAGQFYYLQKVITDISSNNLSKIEIIKALDFSFASEQAVPKLVYGVIPVDSNYNSGFGRPAITDEIIENYGAVLNANLNNDIVLRFNELNKPTLNNYLFIIIPSNPNYQKTLWEINNNAYNRGTIGGEVGVRENLFPDPEIYTYNDIDYYVYEANYQTDISILNTLIFKN